MKSVELFAGAGGLAMGVSLAGFESLAVVEWDRWACDTIRENQKRGFPVIQDWPLWEGDVREFDWGSIPEGIDLLAGGPPCQPFSMGGKHKAYGDERDMFPATVEIVRRLKPKSFIIENVKGLTRSSFANYYQYILLQLEFPEVARRGNESWMEHLRRLQSEKTSGALHSTGLAYNVVPTLVNAADHGVPQKRERVFIVGFRSDLGIEWSFPKPSHSLEALLHSQWISGEYWDRHRVAKAKRPDIPERLAARVKRLSLDLLPPEEKPWRTVRDSLIDLPDPRKRAAREFHNHNFQDGARVYKGHTGSPLDLPAKTLKAGDHGVPGGENMMVLEDGSVRYFSARESARLQTFPDGYVFHGSWTETMRQLGNAVPVALARRVSASVAEKLAEAEISKIARARGRNVA
ncbi:DNA (cytosine-5-)-methyltransferase [Salmonella enterica subsp. enterica serovar Cerro]|nr:DNA (cytosine-5-)-methyltransferase [Salmonella enterica]ECT7562158.1 DNA (cytosine-5-)-methyltransferase [Salmonella enterica subsp. enterica serovar Cerro]ECV2315615.1 DNA (cytosine-5-)-methyltransferase [Salmonella enterica subsp. enterica serovar Muenster]EHH5868387.1 DNA (cytosine-5-)-methyltransferase [Salmonella enterica subsp. enterica serovar Kentucky]EHA6898601.1 DNA (cytosine-5-)-methyltransferase [Salmonella enterica]